MLWECSRFVGLLLEANHENEPHNWNGVFSSVRIKCYHIWIMWSISNKVFLYLYIKMPNPYVHCKKSLQFYNSHTQWLHLLIKLIADLGITTAKLKKHWSQWSVYLLLSVEVNTFGQVLHITASSDCSLCLIWLNKNWKLELNQSRLFCLLYHLRLIF